MFLLAADATHEMLRTMGAAIALGAILIVIARRVDLPAIVLLLVGGVGLGPMGLGVVDPDSLGDGMRVIVAMAVGLILFEGGLTLDVDGYKSAPKMIKRLLTLGVLVTWAGTALAIRFLVGQPWDVSIVGASLVIVTGPTVIAPLLKRIKVTSRLHGILHWEGVLIDPIGVFIAILCYEWIDSGSGASAVGNLLIRVAAGLSIGVVGGALFSWLVKQKVIAREMLNVSAVATAVLVFALAEEVLEETGLLAVTAAGFVFGLSSSSNLKEVRAFKAELTDLLIGTLFILLAARLSFDQFKEFGGLGIAVVAIVMFVVRPLSITLCSFGVGMSWQEKAFLSWVAPRGIVAASMASLFAINFEESGKIADPKFVETFVWSVIIATIMIQGLTAGPIAGLLGVRRPKPTGWLIIGAHEFGRRIARFIDEQTGLEVTMIDTNRRAVAAAREAGFMAHVADGRDVDALAERELTFGIGHVVALTDNEDLNVRLCQAWHEVVGNNVFRCAPSPVEAASVDVDEADAADGRVVWPRLPKPSLLATELARGEATLFEAPVSEPGYAELATPIVMCDPSGASLLPVLPENDDSDAKGTVLYLQRRADYLVRSLRPQLVTTVDADDLRHLLEQLVDLVVQVKPDLPRDATVDELIEREAAFPTVLGKGVAVPHAYSSALDGRLCTIARVPDGVAFGDREGEPIRLVLLLLSPPGDPEGHLAALADIARAVSDDAVRERMLNAETPREVLRAVRKAVR